jgi:L-ascorbate metabolism protein UlaG (beta-lactamase superfamily)
VVILGHIYPEISDDELETIGVVDIVIVPVGGHGYTLDSVGAAQVVRKIDPKIVVPTHYNDPALTYPMPQEDLEMFVKELGATLEDAGPKLKIKSGILPDILIIKEIKRTA